MPNLPQPEDFIPGNIPGTFRCYYIDGQDQVEKYIELQMNTGEYGAIGAVAKWQRAGYASFLSNDLAKTKVHSKGSAFFIPWHAITFIGFTPNGP